MKRHASMNRIYRLVWSRIANSFVAVAENAKGRGKSGSGRKLVAAALALTASAFMLPQAMAGPTGGQVTAGAGSISQSGSTTNIKQTSQNLSLNWATFNVAPIETVNFVQPNATAVAVNRIFDTNGSQILGHLNANGQVYLINPNGILFGQSAQVNVGGLVASTLNINDASLSNTTRSFSGNGTGSVVNQGTITAASGGYVALLGNHVSNQGLITAQLGAVALGAGNAITLTFNGNNLVHLQVDQSTLNALAENGGLIQADGGMVVMTAGAKDSLLASVVNNTGIIEARTVNNQNGTITLLGGMAAGTVNVGGTLDASAPQGGNGGFIETSAAYVNVSDTAHVTTLASPSGNGVGKNGTWLIDPAIVDYTIAASGGNMTGAAVGSALTGGNFTITGTTGNINVNDTVSWSANTLTLNAFNNININSAMNGGAAGKLALLYGQGAVAAGNTSNYFVNAPVSLAAGLNFSTTLGSNGIAVNYTVITALGVQGDATSLPSTMTLQGMAANTSLAGNYVLGANIDASATSTWNSNGAATPLYAGFTPIGNTTSFSGTFDGLSHTISNLFINSPTTIGVGLFGYAGNLAIIRNVGLPAVSVSGYGQVGGLVGNSSGTISNSYATGIVTGTTGGYVGGLAGYAGGSISNSYATSIVTGTTGGYVGGLIGYDVGSISNSYATGSVTAGPGSGNVGGLVGYDAGVSIINSYATGSVTAGTGSYNVGGLVGVSYSTTITNSFYDSTINSTLLGIGSGSLSGVTGMTTTQMQTQLNFTSATSANGNVNPNWDFTTPVWAIDPTHTINSGYPYLVGTILTTPIFTVQPGTTPILAVQPGTAPQLIVYVIAQLDSSLTSLNELGQSGQLALSTTIGGESNLYLRDAAIFMSKQSGANAGKAVFLQIVGCGAK